MIVFHLFSPSISIPHSSAGVFPFNAICGACNYETTDNRVESVPCLCFTLKKQGMQLEKKDNENQELSDEDLQGEKDDENRRRLDRTLS